MARRKEMGIGEALSALNLSLKDLTIDKIKDKFRLIARKIHTDKNFIIDKKEAGERMAKIVEAKKVLLKNFETIKSSSTSREGKDTSFVDWLFGKNKKNPFTVYHQGRSK